LPVNDLPLLLEAAQAAGRIATGFAGQTAARWDKPDDAGPVTEADLAVNDMLHTTLRAARPEYGWLSEETEDTSERLNRDRVFIIDPIDGTRSFIEGSKTWAHSIAVAEQGRVTAAAIYLPLLDKMYAAAAGQGATLNGVPIRVGVGSDPSAASILAARPTADAHHWQGGQMPPFTRAYRPSLAYRLALVAEGRFDAMLTLHKAWEWDIAAGDLILREAGAMVSDRLAKPLIFNNPEPLLDGVVAANPEIHEHITKALAT